MSGQDGSNDTLNGKRALVTGAGAGIGAEISLRLAAAGVTVMATDVDPDTARTSAVACSEVGPTALSARLDVSDPDEVRRLFSRVPDELGGLDILVNNAGILHADPALFDLALETTEAQLGEALSGQPVTTHWELIERTSDEAFDRMLKVHLYGTFYCTREALGIMRRAGSGGRIINMGSIMGTASLSGAPDYCAAKGAILAFTRATAREGASYGVLANAIAPGFIDTAMTSGLKGPTRDILAQQTPLGRFGTAAEIADAALFLAGPGSSFMTGQTVSPNGGIHMSQ